MEAKVKGKPKLNKILIVSNEPLYAQGIAVALKETGVAPYSLSEFKFIHDSESLLHYKFWPSTMMIITEIDLQGYNTLLTIQKYSSSECKIYLFGNLTDEERIREHLKKNIRGYWHKHCNMKQVVRCLKKVESEQRMVFLPDGSGHRVVMDQMNREQNYLETLDLTPRELEVLRQIAQSQTNREIGRNLYISPQTVNVHRKNIMKKLSVKNSVALILKAQSLQII